MPGAFGPPIPDSARDLRRVIEDHANTAWGDIRMVCPLDREHAVKVLCGAFERVLTSTHGNAKAMQQEITVTRKLASALLAQVLRMANGSDKAICGVCEEPKSRHAASCAVGRLQEQCRQLRIEGRSHH